MPKIAEHQAQNTRPNYPFILCSMPIYVGYGCYTLGCIALLKRFQPFLHAISGRRIGTIKKRKNMKKQQTRRGFTLIELLIVVLIVAILAAIAVPQYQKAITKTRYIQAMTLGRKIAQAQQMYKLTNGSYAGRFDKLDIEMPSPTSSRQDSETMEYYFYKWGYCWIHTDTYDACLIYLNSTARAWFLAYREPLSFFECRAIPKEDRRANALCQTVTGKNSGYDRGGMRIYRFGH